jgi:hypothetical protein
MFISIEPWKKFSFVVALTAMVNAGCSGTDSGGAGEGNSSGGAAPVGGQPADDGGVGSDPGPSMSLTRTECAAAGGTEVGDPGNGMTHRPGFLCPESGEPPIGTIRPQDGEPIAIEGSVCCGGKAASGGTDDCTAIRCFRAVECVKECGGEVIQAGCCPCPKGSFDSLECNAPTR